MTALRELTRVALATGVLGAAGCSVPDFVHAAYTGDLPTLQQQVRAAGAAGSIDVPRMRALAEAIARREIRSARGPGAVATVHQAHGCARSVEAELRERAERAEDAGAEAELVLLEAGLAPRAPEVERHARAESGAFRAVAARSAVTAADAPLRREFFVDADERVRRQAFRAAIEVADPDDVEALLEAARLDPDPEGRGLATRALGRIGGEHAVTALADLYPRADAEQRLAIVEAWGTPAMAPVGGASRLVTTAEQGGSLAAVAAAGSLSRLQAPEAATGRAWLARAVDSGTTDERMLALELCPLSDPDALAAVNRASGSDDPAVRVVALARLLDAVERRKEAQRELRELATKSDAAARQAAAALSVLGDATVASVLAKDLGDSHAYRRRQAAAGLLRLGRVAEVATALVDRDPGVRMQVACAVLTRAGG